MQWWHSRLLWRGAGARARLPPPVHIDDVIEALLEIIETPATENRRVAWKFLRAWVALGVVAFVALIIVFYLMVAKPA